MTTHRAPEEEEPREQSRTRARSATGTTAGGSETKQRTTRRSSGQPTSEKAAPTEEREEEGRRNGDGERSPQRDAETETQEASTRPRRLPASQAVRLAMQQVMELTGREPETVTSLERVEEGWRVGVEVVEAHRIPDSADILAIYEAELDEAGELLSYRRTERYSRGHGQERNR